MKGALHEYDFRDVSDFSRRRQAYLSNLGSLEDVLEPLGGPDQTCCLEKAWDGVNFVLTGGAPYVTENEGMAPLNFILTGGEYVGSDLESGYGPARVFDSQSVKAINAALSKVSDADFARAFDVEQMAEFDVYPGIWDEPPEELFEEYASYFSQMRSFICQTAAAGDAMVVRMM